MNTDFIEKSNKNEQITHLENPRITNLLVVGDSESSLSLMDNLLSLAEFTRIVQVSNYQDAVILLMQEDFSVVVLDNDTPHINAISFSRVVRLNHPITRIIVVSKENSFDLIKSFINRGSIDAFLPVPIDDYTAYSVIIEQQAKNEISQVLNALIRSPPKFSPAYYLLHDQSLTPKDPTIGFEFLGCVISYESTTRFAMFYDNFITKDEILLSIYISAITLLGEHLFNKNIMLQEVNFGGISIFFHFQDDLQFSFLIGNLTMNNIEKVEEFIKGILDELINPELEFLTNKSVITEQDDVLIAKLLERKILETFDNIIEDHKNSEKLNLIILGVNLIFLLNPWLIIIILNFQIGLMMKKSWLVIYIKT